MLFGAATFVKPTIVAVSTKDDTVNLAVSSLPILSAVLQPDDTQLWTIIAKSSWSISVFLKENTYIRVSDSTSGVIHVLHTRLAGDTNQLYSTIVPPGRFYMYMMYAPGGVDDMV
jgi:hypothetical protein